MRPILAFLVFFAAFIGLVMPVWAGAPHVVEVKNLGEELPETPLDVILETPIEPGIYGLGIGDAPHIRAEVYEDGGKLHLVAVFPSIAKGSIRYTLSGPIKIKGFPAVRLSKEGENVAIELFRKPFTTHHIDLGPKPILFPLIGPTEEPITRSFPMKEVAGEDKDHPHQRSFWFTHGEVNGIDFWSEQDEHGSIRQTGLLTVKTGFAAGILRTSNDWLGPDGKKICVDERVLRVYATKSSRVLDYDVTIASATGPVTFGDTKEGTFGLRVASSMDANRKPGGRITNAEGLVDAAAWVKPSPWVDYSGPVAGQTVGIAIMNHPASFRAPTPWHVRDYGLFASNPFGRKDFKLDGAGVYTLIPGEKLVFRYRVVLHSGDATAIDLPALYRGYAEGVVVDVQ